MTLYRMKASDDYCMVQSQYALASHQEEVAKEPWFIEFIMTRLFNEIQEKAHLLDLGPVNWEGWSEVWEYVGTIED